MVCREPENLTAEGVGMERLNIAGKNHQDWFGGHYSSDQQYDSEFEENMLCRVRLLYHSVRMEPKSLQPSVRDITVAEVLEPIGVSSSYFMIALDNPLKM